MKIALHGRICSGKSFVAHVLHEQHGFQIVTLAAPIYAAAAISKRYLLTDDVFPFMLSDFLLGLTDPETARRMFDEWMGMMSKHTELLISDEKPRAFLQEWGTVFKMLDDGVFIREALDEAVEDCCCDDLRLVDEAWAFRDAGWLLVKVDVSDAERLRRVQERYPGQAEFLDHHTETELAEWEAWDAVISTDCLQEEVPQRVTELLDELGFYR